MGLSHLLTKRLDTDGPVRVGLIGAGKFGAMFLAQVPTSPGIEVTWIADLDVAHARDTCQRVGWQAERIAATQFTTDSLTLLATDQIDVVVEATGDPLAGIVHARAAFRSGKHMIMVNVEADVLAGPLLAREAAAAGVVYSMAYGDQPALVCELVDWATTCGFEVVAAGKGTKYLPEYHCSTPDTVWEHYGLTAEQATAAGMNSQMFNSFLDGTKSAIEMGAIANATGLAPSPNGLAFPACGTGELPNLLRPVGEGGILHHSGQVEVISSLQRDGQPVNRDLRWGVYVVVKAATAYAADCFQQYGLLTDDSGRFAATYKPYHLIGMELNVSILSAALRGEATGCTEDFCGDVVAIAKRDLSAGEMLDGEGGYTVWGKLLPARDSLLLGALPIGLAKGITLRHAVSTGQPVCWSDVDRQHPSAAATFRLEMEQAYRDQWKLAPDKP